MLLIVVGTLRVPSLMKKGNKIRTHPTFTHPLTLVAKYVIILMMAMMHISELVHVSCNTIA